MNFLSTESRILSGDKNKEEEEKRRRGIFTSNASGRIYGRMTIRITVENQDTTHIISKTTIHNFRISKFSISSIL